ncbi:signal transduction histidine kinase [Herbaspirillum sp. Sphag1AN]|uniref:ATP-binding protein n=1 Tax=unclassified Herbaspirillum TaxID=2624150 RepID=UPI00160A80D5|nr:MULTISPECIES: ATP-binding protein [unclassified Herbaspirillum]MBB3210825.1 signal transduction histidine kinase [Herbaspirillum sp. Sphag1AN]MBB3244455.1 signal transduction histidine kinase [Herbaspirillum sp. Sphag64]
MKNAFGSIANRVFLMLLTGIIVATVITTWLSFNERRSSIRELRLQHIAERVEQVVQALDKIDPATREVVLRAAGNFGYEASFVNSISDTADNNSSPMVDMLKAQLGDDRVIVVQRETDCAPRRGPPGDIQPGFPPPPSPPKTGQPGPADGLDFQRHETCRVIYVSLQDKALLRLRLHLPGEPPVLRGRSPGPLPYGGAYILLYLVLIALLAYVVAKMTTRPIKQLASAATELGRDLDHPPLPEKGPTEIRQAAHAFNAMQARIRRQIQHRTHMLAAITHDLQTPLTRLRLRLEKVSDPELRQKLVDDLAVMQGMVREGLDLARSMDSTEPMQRLDIDSLLDSVCADASDAGQDVSLQGNARTSILAQPNALRRCLTNLLDNAVKYGQRARVSIAAESETPESLCIRIHDDGPGIAENQLEAVFEPFYRLETSRSRDTGGTGLGLTIARNIAENHGAQLRLRNHPDGGLEVILVLPLPL